RRAAAGGERDERRQEHRRPDHRRRCGPCRGYGRRRQRLDGGARWFVECCGPGRPVLPGSGSDEDSAQSSGDLLMISLRLVLLILAVVVFAAAAFGIQSNRVNLVALGLMLWVLSAIAT